MTLIATEEQLAGLRRSAIFVYGLYIASYFLGVTAVIGVIVAYLKRGEARGTVYESHFSNQITVFWVVLVVGILGGLLTIIVIGWLVLFLLAIWSIWRVVKGLIRAMDRRPYR